MPFSHLPYGLSSFGVPIIPASWGRSIGFGGKGTVSSQTALASTVAPGPGSQVFFVNSNLPTASDAAYSNGLDPLRPFKTINFAVSRCIANNGDVIFVGPGHVETVSVAGALTIAVAGISIIGVGNDFSDRPQIQYTTSAAATVTITAASTWIQGIDFRNSIDARVDGIIISANDCRLIDCDFFDDTGKSSLISVRTTAAANRFRAIDLRCYFSENTGTQRTEFMRIVGGNDHEIIFCYSDVAGSYSTAVFNNVTTAFTGMVMADCYWANGHATAPAAAFVAGSTGLMVDRADFLGQGISAVTLPNAGGYSIDGDSVLTTPTHQATPVQGSTGAFQKSLVSSSLTTSYVNFITCSAGSVIIEAITCETDATGLAGATNFQIGTDNANGITGASGILWAETVANLGANKTISGAQASVQAFTSRQGMVLESGKHLQVLGTASAGTGAGKLFVNVTYRVLSGAPTLS